MKTRVSIAFALTAGLVLGAALMRLLDVLPEEVTPPSLAPSAPLLGAMPRSREHVAVLSWIFEHRTDAQSLEFLRWSVPKSIPENPFCLPLARRSGIIKAGTLAVPLASKSRRNP